MFSVAKSYAKDDIVMYDNCVAALDTKCPNFNFCWESKGVFRGTYEIKFPFEIVLAIASLTPWSAPGSGHNKLLSPFLCSVSSYSNPYLAFFRSSTKPKTSFKKTLNRYFPHLFCYESVLFRNCQIFRLNAINKSSTSFLLGFILHNRY